MPQFGARSVVVVDSLYFLLLRLLSFFFLSFFALQLFALRFSLPRFVVVSFVQCNKFHLTANEGTRHPPAATDVLRRSPPSLHTPSLSLSLSLCLSLSVLLLASCGLRFVVCYLFLFPCAPYYLLFLLCAVHTDTHTDTHSAHSPIQLHVHVFTVTFTCVRPARLCSVCCVCSAICVCLFARVCLCFLFHFTLPAFMCTLLFFLLLCVFG